MVVSDETIENGCHVINSGSRRLVCQADVSRGRDTLLALKSVNELIFAFYSTYKRPNSLLPFMLLNINLK